MNRPVPSIKMLQSVHCFPGKYIIKIIGPHSQDFVQSAHRGAQAILGGAERFEVKARASSRGSYLSLTLIVQVQTAHQVQALYVELLTLEGLKFIM